MAKFILKCMVFGWLAAVVAFAQSPKLNPSSSHDNNVEYAGLFHDTFDSFYRTPFGAVIAGTAVTIRFRTFKNDVTAVSLRVYAYDPPTGTTAGPTDTALAITNSDATYDYWILVYQTPSQPKIIYYKFRIVDGTSTAFYTDSYIDDHDNLNQGGPGAAAASEPFPAFQLTVYDPAFVTPAWIQNSVVYQIFPDRFRNGDPTNDWCRNGSTTGCPSLYGGPTGSNVAYTNWNTRICDPRLASPCPNNYGAQFYGGDLKGVEQKLDYIKSMGFDAIYLNPIFKARSNHRYDTDDYRSVADELGGDAAFASLASAANSRGIKLILDGVFNHMSQDSEYFDFFHRVSSIGACESLSSPYRSWFVFSTNNTPCTTADYPGWFGFSGLPVLDKNLPEIRDYFYRTPNTNITQYWYDRGAGGWRFDVATDIPHDFWHDYRGFAKSYKPDGVLIGEVFPDSSQYLAGDQFDGVMNYRFRKNVIGFARGSAWSDNDNNGGNVIAGLTPSMVDTAMRSVREDYPEPAQRAMLNLLDSHDTNRALYTLTVAGDVGSTQARERLKMAAAFQYTYIGAPMVYYGDEAGINAPSAANSPGGLPEDDPYNRAPYPWADESGDQNIYGPTDAGLIAYYTKLGSIRKAHVALRSGTFQTILTGDTSASATDDNTYSFGRISGSDKVVVAMNNGSSSNTVALPVNGYFSEGSAVTDILNNTNYTVSGGLLALNISAHGAVILTRPMVAAPFDYDGDRRTDPSVFRPSSGSWYLLGSTAGFSAYQFGAPGDLLTPADFTGDGKTDVAVFRPSAGTWFILRSEDSTFYGAGFGSAIDIPTPGDFDGDGRADLAVYRPGSQAYWYLLQSTAGFAVVPFGTMGDVPAAGDFDGDGKSDVSVYRPSLGQWFRFNSSNGSFYGVQFGTAGDMIVPGDYTGDGKTDSAIFRPSTSTWYILRSEEPTFYGAGFGTAGDTPAPGDYDGDGRYDLAIWRSGAQSIFYIQQSSAGFSAIPWGLAGDRPTPNAFVY